MGIILLYGIKFKIINNFESGNIRQLVKIQFLDSLTGFLAHEKSGRQEKSGCVVYTLRTAREI